MPPMKRGGRRLMDLDFEAWLAAQPGVTLLEPTEWEVARWTREGGGMSVVYRNKEGYISGFVGEGERAWSAWHDNAMDYAEWEEYVKVPVRLWKRVITHLQAHAAHGILYDINDRKIYLEPSD